jgi:hypothetical protein
VKLRWLAVAAVVLAMPPALAAGAPGDRGVRLTYDVGALVPLGGRERLVDDAMLLGFTGSVDLSRFVALVGALSGARTKADGAWEGQRTLLQYDAGVQGQYRIATGAETVVVPFLGAGLGGRTRDDSEVGGVVDTVLTGYLALGGRLEYGMGLVGLTARDLVSAARGPWVAHLGSLRHDLAVVASFGMRF